MLFSAGLPLEIIAGSLVGGMLTELGPVLTAIVLAGRMGAGIGAELGTMQVTNQIDALLTRAFTQYGPFRSA